MIRLLQHPAALILLCFALAGTPVSYRGGASDAHAHMFLEFLMDASAGSFAHHHADTSSRVDDPAAADHDHGSGHRHESAVAGGERFAPSVSAFVVGDLGQLASVSLQHDFGLTENVATAFHPIVVPLNGRAHSPTAPPPR